MNKRSSEIGRFIITGGICFLVEFGILVFLKQVFSVDTLIATPIAFLVSVTINYIICMKWVFQGAEDGGSKTKLAFLIAGAMGLVLNEVLMLLFRLLFGEDRILFTISGFSCNMYMLNKVFATILVMIWNYFTKRKILVKDRSSD